MKHEGWRGKIYKDFSYIRRVFKQDGRSSNGRTTDFGSVYLGSNPSLPASKKKKAAKR